MCVNKVRRMQTMMRWRDGRDENSDTLRFADAAARHKCRLFNLFALKTGREHAVTANERLRVLCVDADSVSRKATACPRPD